MKILKVKKKSDNIYEVLYSKGVIFKTYNTDDMYMFLGDFRYCKNGHAIDYYASTSIRNIALMLRNIGDEYSIESN